MVDLNLPQENTGSYWVNRTGFKLFVDTNPEVLMAEINDWMNSQSYVKIIHSRYIDTGTRFSMAIFFMQSKHANPNSYSS